MRDKNGVSKSYTDQCKEKYLGNPNPPVYRKAVVIGAEEGNIGWQIADHLEQDDFQVSRPVVLAQNFIRMSGCDTIVLNNAVNHMDWIEDYPSHKIEDVVYNSLTASMICASNFVKYTIDDMHKKHIVFIGSMAYNHVLNGSAPYCAAKAGLAHFARCLAWELAPKNYDVFVVHPSNVEGAPMSKATIQGLMRYRDLSYEEARAYWGAVLPRERWLSMEDIAGVVSDLVSGRWTYASGSNIELPGGQR